METKEANTITRVESRTTIIILQKRLLGKDTHALKLVFAIDAAKLVSNNLSPGLGSFTKKSCVSYYWLKNFFRIHDWLYDSSSLTISSLKQTRFNSKTEN